MAREFFDDRLHKSGSCSGGSCRCYDDAYHEYGGLCASHWLELTDEQRAALHPHYKVPRTVTVERHEHTHHNPPYRPLLVAFIGFIAGLAGVGTMQLIAWFIHR